MTPPTDETPVPPVTPPTDGEAEEELEPAKGQEVLDLAGQEPPPPAGPAPGPEVGGVWNPEPTRERIRGALAVGLVVFLALIAIASFVLLATNTIALDEVQGLLTALFTPLLALAGTALGFYFGGQRQV